MENHPRYQAEQRRLQELHDEQHAALLSAAQRIDNSYESAQATESEFADRLKQQEQQISSGGGLASYDTLAENVESDRALYDAVVAQMHLTTSAGGTSLTPAPVESSVQVKEEPLVAAKPVKPRRLLILVAALLAGVVIGVGYIYGEDYVRSAFTNVFDVESSLGIPVLAAVPKSPAFAGSGPVSANPNSGETEAFRTLRAAIHLHEKRGAVDPAAKDLVRNAVLFTSANPGEGKTSCAYNYAVMLARQGLRTLLIDGDLRRGTMTSRLLEVRNATGLADVLTGRSSPQDACLTMQEDKLFFLPAGRTSPHTAETLDSVKLGFLLQKLASQFDHVVIDTPPINAVSDCLLLVPHVLMNCLVIHAGTTQKRAVAHACDELKKVNRGLIGAVLNQVGTDARAAYECYGYARTVSYDYSYSA